jgi:hypothetical protein
LDGDFSDVRIGRFRGAADETLLIGLSRNGSALFEVD